MDYEQNMNLKAIDIAPAVCAPRIRLSYSG